MGTSGGSGQGVFGPDSHRLMFGIACGSAFKPDSALYSVLWPQFVRNCMHGLTVYS